MKHKVAKSRRSSLCASQRCFSPTSGLDMLQNGQDIVHSTFIARFFCRHRGCRLMLQRPEAGPARSEFFLSLHGLPITMRGYAVLQCEVYNAPPKVRWCPSIACMKGLQCATDRLRIEPVDKSQTALGKRQRVEQTNSYAT